MKESYMEWARRVLSGDKPRYRVELEELAVITGESSEPKVPLVESAPKQEES